jgi:hypothetical protein
MSAKEHIPDVSAHDFSRAVDRQEQNCQHDWMPFGSSRACRKCGADIRVGDSACSADYPTELRKVAALIERSGLGHTAEMIRGAADEIDSLRRARNSNRG